MMAGGQVHTRGDERFFLAAASAMVAVVVAGFLTLWLRGISTFAAPWPVHLHAVLFMGFVGFFLGQVALATTGSVALHRRLGWIAAVCVPVMLVNGTATVVRMVRLEAVPPFWTPAYFLVMNMMALVTFGALVAAAIRLRRRTDWHRRLMLAGMAALLVTPVNRLMPDGLLAHSMSLIPAMLILLFPLAGIGSDVRRSGRAHPAWLWGLGALVLTGVATETLGRSALATAAVAAIAK